MANSSMAPEVVRRVEPWHGEPVLPGWWAPLFASGDDAAIFLSPWWMQSWLETYVARRLTASNVRLARQMFNRHAKTLAAMERQYGVPSRIVTVASCGSVPVKVKW